MTVYAPEARLAETRYVPWLARFRRTGRGLADLSLERIDDPDAADPRASTAADDGLQVAVRGFLYDRSELARDLRLESVPGADAELVLHAYRRRGQDGLRRLRGIFDIFIWDAERDRLLAVRDPLGVEPLFYARAGDELLFAASPTALVKQPGVPRAPNRITLVETLYWRWPFPEDTCLEGVRRVLPGHVLTVTNAGTTSTRYWNPRDDLEEDGWIEADELDQFDALLERSVSQCLELGRSGIFLSGGLDSVSVAAVALDVAQRRGFATPLALSLAFPTPETSEKEVQIGVAKGLGLPQVLLDLEESVAPEGLVKRAVDLSADWPWPRTYLWSGPYLELAQAGAAEGARVIMTGAGGDEWLSVDLFLAADFIQALQFRNLYRFVRSKLSSWVTPTAPSVWMLLWEYGLGHLLRFHARALLAEHAPELLRARRRWTLARSEMPWLAPDPKLRDEVRARRETTVGRMPDGREVGGRFRFYASDGGTLLDHPIISLEREDDYEVGVRAGVEFLHPYWEPDLISFLYRVPPELLLRGGLEKGLVRGAIARRFPKLGFERQKKVVCADYHYSVLRRDGPDIVRRLGGCKTLADLGVVDGAQANKLIEEGLAGTDHHELHRVWELITLEAWAREVITSERGV